jgi:phosphatidate cytidylyltransferase
VLMKRILSAALGIIFIFFMLYIGGWFFRVSVLIMSLIMMHEFYHAFIKKGYKPLTWLGYLFIIILFCSYLVSYKYLVVLITEILFHTFALAKALGSSLFPSSP